MGSLFQRLLKGSLEVASSLEESRQLVSKVDVVIVGVPLEKTLEVIGDIAPLMREDQLLLDITSLKKAPCEAMLASKASVIGMHPLFGPSIERFEGQRMVICPVRPGGWKEKVLEWFKELSIVETTPQHHDEMMASIQALVLFMNISFVAALEGQNRDEFSLFATPIFQRQIETAQRIFSQAPSLYASIQMDNPYFEKVLSHFEKVVGDMKKIILSKDRKAFIEKFEELSRYV